MTQWFESWFDSSYYQLLYAHRDSSEAEKFVRNLMAHFSGYRIESVLDLACGSGRYAEALSNAGLKVTGVDLSVESILKARARNIEGAEFVVGDMRHFYLKEEFDLVLNLFTSFGYFDSRDDNGLVMERISQHLRSGGMAVIDYLNPFHVKANLVENEIVEREGVTFEISRKTSDSHVYKMISIPDEGLKFEERVQLLSKEDFEKLAMAVGLRVSAIFGSYDLDPYAESSERQIFILTK